MLTSKMLEVDGVPEWIEDKERYETIILSTFVRYIDPNAYRSVVD